MSPLPRRGPADSVPHSDIDRAVGAADNRVRIKPTPEGIGHEDLKTYSIMSISANGTEMARLIVRNGSALVPVAARFPWIAKTT